MMAGADGSLLADVETFNIGRLAAAGCLMQKVLAKVFAFDTPRPEPPAAFAA